MTLLSFEITKKVISEFYGPVVRIVYVPRQIFSRTEHHLEVAQCMRTMAWVRATPGDLFGSKVPPSLDLALTKRMNELAEVRRSSYPPVRND